MNYLEKPKYIYYSKSELILEEKDVSSIKNIVVWIVGLLLGGLVLSLSFLRYRVALGINANDGWTFVLIDGSLFRVFSLIEIGIGWLAISKRSLRGLIISIIMLCGVLLNLYLLAMEVVEQEAKSFIIACPGWSRSGYTILDSVLSLLVFSSIFAQIYLLLKTWKPIKITQ